MDASAVAEAIAAFGRGEIVVVTDDDDRENEGDLIMAAVHATPEKLAFIIRHTSGIICTPMPREDARRLQLAPMVQNNQARHGTGFTVTIEAAEGVSTGVSAQDRITTIEAALRSTAQERHIVSPGHVFPLRARDGGVLTRRGHTEGSVDLARLAGLRPAAVLCELMNPDGSMARGEQVAVYARQYNLPVLTIEELARYRETMVELQAEPA